MRKLSVATLVVFATALTCGCGGTYTVSRMNTNAPEPLVSVAISPQAGNSPEVSAVLSSTLAEQGLAVNPMLPENTVKSDQVDAVLTYMDVWRWDLATYMQSILISLYNAKTGELLVTGRWRDSFFHSYNRGEAVSRQLLSDMFATLKSKPAPTPPSTRQ